MLSLKSGLTIENAIRTAAAAFEDKGLHFGHGTETAVDEASWLVLHAMGLPPDRAPDYTKSLTPTQVESCNALLARRIDERKPAAYLTGTAWFAGLEFLSDERALVPRSPLAEFIQEEFFGLLDNTVSPRLLDLCTGGGCIAIACAHARSDAAVIGSDVSADALALAQENISKHGMGEQVQLVQGSLFEPVDGRFALIVSNPPYVDAADIDAMPAEFSHEPLLGLAAGGDGLDLVRVMLREAAHYLEPDGHLLVEVGNSAEALEAAFPDVAFSWLQFAQGGHGVFLLSRQELIDAADSF